VPSPWEIMKDNSSGLLVARDINVHVARGMAA
jgi:hypothetical protein